MRATTRNVESKPVQNRVPSSQNKMLNDKQCVYKMGSTTTLYHQIFVQNESHFYSSPIQFPLFSFSCSLLHLDWSALFRRPPLYFGSTLAACWWPLSKPPKIPRPKMEVIVMFTVNSAYVLFCLLCSCSLVSLPPFKTCISLPSAWWLCVSLWWWHFWESKSSAQATNIHFKSTDLYVLIKVDAILDVRDSHLAEWEATEKLPETDSFQAPGPWKRPCAWK